ncbi:type VII secretion protein EccB [Saccharomonospora glauca]|uniref:Type VII secretion protein EccB, Actinobacterial n=1 Tax=Saccharomonospora glauca K62 TaxID=928724 RepID=I1CXM2_9PSEU|nr:type VII secretion protein EccB [Saccharomonospora glauca]EIE97446.1 type VII secretion protein EccB, Actinobacterial [Saccharomonospora glauca K62]
MPSTPTTKSQVQAYQFVLRRMQSALVRKDAVMLHDPMRTHSRATIVGVVLSCLGMLGFIIFGLFKPDPKAPDSGIVIGEQSGTVYVIAGNPKKLIPTFNLASARLILMAQNQSEGQEGGQGAPGGGAMEAVEPQIVSDEQLKDIPKGRLQGIPDGPDLLPTEEQLISTDWGVCDQINVDRSLNDPVAREKAVTETTVLAGVKNLGRELAQNQALLVEADDGKHYLVYRQKTDANKLNANTVRAEVDLTQNAVTAALKLDARMARHISTGLLNAIPSVGTLDLPAIPGVNEQPDFDGTALKVGDVFVTEAAGGTDFYVVLKEGVQRVSKAVADMILYTPGIGGSNMSSVTPDVLQGLPQVTPGSPGYLDVEHYPDTVPTVLDPLQHPVSCLGWNIRGEGEQRDAFTSVYISSVLPVPSNPDGTPQVVKIGTPSPDGQKIDNFYMQPGYAAAVQGATTKDTFGRGSIQLISDRGVRYGVPNQDIAKGLGLTKLSPAPESIIKLLPTGPSLNLQDAQRTYDTVPVDAQAGAVIQPQEQAAPQGGN